MEKPLGPDDVRQDQTILGERLRERRQALGLTLKQVADGASLSVGFISQIERGITTPSLSSLVNVSRVLGQQVSSFLSLPAGTASLTRLDQRPHYAVGSSALVYERISAAFPGYQLTTVIIHQPPGYRSELIAHDGEELFYMLSGAMTVEVEGEVFVLEAGDSLHFSSQKVHTTWNHTDAEAVLLHTCTMDVFGDREGRQDVATPLAAQPARTTTRAADAAPSRRRPPASHRQTHAPEETTDG